MKVFITVITIIIVILFYSGCTNCYNFSDLVNGRSYNVGQTFTTSGVLLEVEQFQWGNSNWTSDGFVEVDDENYASGSGLDIQLNNVNVFFAFEYPVSEITFKFGEFGGNINIKVNGEFRNIDDLISLNGSTIGTVLINVNATQQRSNWYGNITLTGNINDFTLGGQELWIDDICYSK
jgi:hypothetical protein